MSEVKIDMLAEHDALLKLIAHVDNLCAKHDACQLECRIGEIESRFRRVEILLVILAVLVGGTDVLGYLL